MYIFFFFFQSNDDKITFISLYNVLCHVCICLLLTLIGYCCAVNKILFYSVLCSRVSFFSPLITFFSSAQIFQWLNIKLSCIIKIAYNPFDFRMLISNRKQGKISFVSSL